MGFKLKEIERILVDIDGQKFVVDPMELLTLDYTQIREHLLKYPADFAWVGAIREAVVKSESEAEFELETCYARLEDKYRSESKLKGNELARVVKMSIAKDPEYMKAKRHVINLSYTAGKLKAVLNSLAKLDSVLIQLSTLYKQESQRS